jgi:hypothetical protein
LTSTYLIRLVQPGRAIVTGQIIGEGGVPTRIRKSPQKEQLRLAMLKPNLFFRRAPNPRYRVLSCPSLQMKSSLSWLRMMAAPAGMWSVLSSFGSNTKLVSPLLPR